MKQEICYYRSSTAAWLLMALSGIKLSSLILFCFYLTHQPSRVYHLLPEADELHYELHVHDFEKKQRL